MSSPRPKFLLLSFAFVTSFLGMVASSQAEEKATIWKLKRDESTVYLAGSVHLLREQDHPLPKAYDRVYKDSDRVYFEVDMAEMDSMATKMKVMTMSMIPDGGMIKDLISEETYAELQAYLDEAGEEMGAMAAMFERLTPGMLAMTITSLEAMKIGAIPDLGVEKVFDAKARKDGKPVKGLETTEFQIGLFNRLSKEEQDNLLKMTLQQVEETPKMLGDMINTWKSGDAEGLDQLLNKYFDDEENATLTKILLHDRNASWIQPIEDELKTPGNAMFIVGAGHLVGDQSVIEMLEEKGYLPVQVNR